MLVNASNLNSIFVGLKTVFDQAFSGAPSTWEKLATKVPSNTREEDYGWISTFPRMRKWVGDKVLRSLSAFKYTLVNDDFEATVEVDRNDIEDDTLGKYSVQSQGAGVSAKQMPDELVGDLPNNAFTEACYDGQYFCDTDHPVKNAAGVVGSVSNKGTAALTCATLAAAIASYGAARTAMRKFKDDEGRPLGVRPTVLLVPPALEDIANVLMTAERLEDGKPNPYKGTAEVVVGDWLTSDTAWFLLDCSKPIKPFIYQERKAPVFVQQTDPQADDVFMRKKYKFGAEARAQAGYSLWQLCYGSTGEG